MVSGRIGMTTGEDGSGTPALLAALRRARVLAIVRGSRREAALDTVVTLAECGFDVIEVSFTTPDADWVVERSAERLGDSVLLGLGTVLSAEQAATAAELGAFVVTPAISAGARAAAAGGTAVLCGAWSPSEVVAAVELGAAAVKLFPADVGGPGYVRALRQPLPDVSLVAVGGVGPAQLRPYLDAGAVAAGVGSPLVGDAADGGDLGALRERAAALLAARDAR
jgi:2-dehydro-3-deoxyphosphogluconate aldolase/(4S)-4-hydroxy-2-oxoglutarate aldolase